MRKRISITLDEEVYKGLYRTTDKRRMSQFIEDLLRPHILDTALNDGYREIQAQEWCNSLSMDMSNKTL